MEKTLAFKSYENPINNKSVFILSGPKQSGKTTMLMNWAKERKDVAGILTPQLSDKRIFMDVCTSEEFSMEANNPNEPTLSIGRFIFSKVAFTKAIHIIKSSIKKSGWLIVDEIGPLELQNEGFADVLSDILDSDNTGQNIILVVRAGLSLQIAKKFGINPKGNDHD